MAIKFTSHYRIDFTALFLTFPSSFCFSSTVSNRLVEICMNPQAAVGSPHNTGSGVNEYMYINNLPGFSQCLLLDSHYCHCLDHVKARHSLSIIRVSKWFTRFLL